MIKTDEPLIITLLLMPSIIDGLAWKKLNEHYIILKDALSESNVKKYNDLFIEIYGSKFIS